jgi:adenylate kinase family enzyme
LDKKTQIRFKTYKSDAAPFFFYIEIYPFDTSLFKNVYLNSLIKTIEKNQIVPIPMRVDRVFNGDSSVIIRPREVVSFQMPENQLAVINPDKFLSNGIKNLIYFSEIRSSEKLLKSLSRKNINSWWEATRFLYGNLYRLEEDFSAFLRAYLHTMVKNYIEGGDIVSAAIQYCQILEDICKKRMEQNRILIELDGEQTTVKMYKKKVRTYYKKLKKVTENQVSPELIDIEVFNYSKDNWSHDKTIRNGIESTVKKYIPLLFYDDLQECMLLNLRNLQENEKTILDPSILIEKNIIAIINSELYDDNLKIKNSWWNDFSDIKPELILNEMFQSLNK